MEKGPRLNNISVKFTTRDSLGIEGVATSISAEICPIVNTVTPRPFYWAFITWCFYDYYKNCKPKDRSLSNVYKYVKMQNYFLALARNIVGIEESGGFTGTDTIKNKVDLKDSTFSYDEKYLKTTLSNMAYYIAGLSTMGFITDNDAEERFKYPHLRPEGEKLAKAFEKVIGETEYYKKYRSTGKNIPKKVLEELGNCVTIDLKHFNEVKQILVDHLFNRKSQKKLIESHNYLKFLHKKYNLEWLNPAMCREIFFDYFSPRCKTSTKYPKDLKEIIDSWEIVVGRQYFTAGLEMIWKYMLENLNTPKTYKQWFNDCLNESTMTIDLKSKLITLIPQCNYNYMERENMIWNAESKVSSHKSNIENGIKLILSIYNRFNEREGYSSENREYCAISFNSFIALVEEYKEKTVEEFIQYIMYHYLLDQHMKIAFEKMLQGRDGYYVEKIEEGYVRKEYFSLGFQGIRMVQLFTAMQDLDVLEGE